jgi:hypothetical protein
MNCYSASPVNLNYPPDPGSSQPYYSQSGYSGTDRGDPHNQQSVQGRNNPDAADREDVGPIPAGTWITGSPYYSPNTGPNTIRLDPIGGDPCANTPRNCSTFRIHGAAAGNNDASSGCIILPPNRTTIPPEEIVFVVP